MAQQAGTMERSENQQLAMRSKKAVVHALVHVERHIAREMPHARYHSSTPLKFIQVLCSAG